MTTMDHRWNKVCIYFLSFSAFAYVVHALCIPQTAFHLFWQSSNAYIFCEVLKQPVKIKQMLAANHIMFEHVYYIHVYIISLSHFMVLLDLGWV